jgi:hypothetical protein
MEPRPTKRSPEVIDNAVQRMVSDLRLYRGPEFEFPDTAVEQLRKVVMEFSNGYRRCKALDKLGWEADDKIVYILSPDAGHERLALREAEEAWVMRNGVRFPAQEGDHVSFAVRTNASGEPLCLLGKVSAVRGTLARAIVVVPPTAAGSGEYDVMAEHCIKRWHGNDPEVLQMVRPMVGFNVA